MGTDNYSSDLYPLREPREKIEEWKRHAREKYDMHLASMIRWLINLDMKGQLDAQQNGKASYINSQEAILFKERIKELEREIEDKDCELTSRSMSGNVRAIIALALNMEKEVRRLFSDQPRLSANIDTIARALAIPESSETERHALEFVLHHLVGIEYIRFKGGKYLAG